MIRKLGFLAVLTMAWQVAGDRPTGRALGEGKAEPKAGPAAPYVHIVIFHLKKDAPENAADAIIADCHAMLAKVPSVRGIKCGRPAEKVTPDLGKKDFQVGLLVFVDDFDGLKAYLDHPLHGDFVKKHGQHIDREQLKVYDFVDRGK